jgi:hypothetical protein
MLADSAAKYVRREITDDVGKPQYQEAATAVESAC